MIFLASLYGAPCPKKEQKKFVCGPVFGASLFKLCQASRFLSVWRFAFAGLGLFGAPHCLDPALKQAEPKTVWAPYFGALIFKFWSLTFSGGMC
jgi:hypothetical protein